MRDHFPAMLTSSKPGSDWHKLGETTFSQCEKKFKRGSERDSRGGKESHAWIDGLEGAASCDSWTCSGGCAEPRRLQPHSALCCFRSAQPGTVLSWAGEED